MERIAGILRNKYLIATVVFIAWMLFFDRNDFMSQYEYQTQLNKLEEEKAFYLKEIEQVRSELEGLTYNKEKLEKLAREKYLMKKENEDVFVIVKEDQKKKRSLF